MSTLQTGPLQDLNSRKDRDKKTREFLEPSKKQQKKVSENDKKKKKKETYTLTLAKEKEKEPAGTINTYSKTLH